MTAILTCIPEPDRDRRVAGAILAADGLTLARRCVDAADLRAVARTKTATIAVVSGALRRWDASAIQELGGHGIAVIGLVDDDEQERRFRQWGAHAVTVRAWQEDDRALLDAIVAVAQQRESSPPTPVVDGPNLSGGRCVAVWGPVGSPGRSFVALNLAAELSAAGESVLLVDADPFAASLGQLLGVTIETPGLLAAARAANHGSLDLPLLSRLAPEVAPGLRLLDGGVAPHRAPVPAAGAEAVWRVARLLADVVVVDCGWPLPADEFDTLGGGAIQTADVVIAVGAADPISLTRLIQAWPDLTEAAATTPSIAINRVRRGALPGGRSAVDQALRSVIGRDADTLIPADAGVDAAVLAGRSLAEVSPRSAARLALAELARSIAGQSTAAASSRSASAASLRRRIARSSGSFTVAIRPSRTKATAV